jgi:16S rRNA (guanine527-N7)-methyltransferase
MSQKDVVGLPLWRIPEWFQDLNETQLALLKAYYLDICKWTPKINLISAGTVRDADRIHFADSILGCQLFSNQVGKSPIKDLGSGNGLPGIVFAILNPDIEVECIDSDERKIAFIKQFAIRQGLKNLKARSVRIENLGPLSYKFASARGLGSVGKILELSEEGISLEGTLFMFKGYDWRSEIDKVPESKRSTWNISVIGTYNLPDIGEGLSEMRVILRAMRR